MLKISALMSCMWFDAERIKMPACAQCIAWLYFGHRIIQAYKALSSLTWPCACELHPLSCSAR